MEHTDKRYTAYLNILKEELVPAMGCTEPIALAYAGAKARQVLGTLPDRVAIEASDNIIKNVKSVVVPNTGNLKGIEASAVAGIVAGDPDKVLEVISSVDRREQEEIRAFLETRDVGVANADSDLIFDLKVSVFSGNDRASVRISHFHTNIVTVTRNNEVLFERRHCDGEETAKIGRASCRERV